MEALCNESRMNLRKAKKDLERLSEESKEEERLFESNEKKIESLKKTIMQSKKKINDNENEIGVLNKRIRESEEDYDEASKRMNLLYFEYFDVAKENINTEW